MNRGFAHSLRNFLWLACFGAGLLLLANTALAAKAEVATVSESVDFGRHVVPLLYKLGCSSGSCHGSFSGKGGLRLSLFASEPDIDYANLHGAFGRRLNRLSADESLLLRKPSQNGVPHGGGLRLKPDSAEYQVLKNWIAAGARYDSQQAVTVVDVRVEPATVTIPLTGQEPHQVKVMAQLSDGSQQDVTWYCTFESRDPAIAEIGTDGTVSPKLVGDVAVLAHYAGKIAYTVVEVPGPEVPESAFPTESLSDPIDKALAGKLRRLNIVPSPACSDEEFVRRIYLDVTSTLPSPEDVRLFVNDPSPDKRHRLIDQLLEHPFHHALWATRLTDMMGADNRYLDPVPFHDWFRNKLEQNMPWDQVIYGVLCGTAADERPVEEIAADLERIAEERRLKKEAEKKAKEEAKDKAEKEEEAEPLPLDPDAPKPWQAGYGARNTLDAIYTGSKFTQQIRDENNKNLKTIIDSKLVALQLSHAFLGLQLTCAQCHKHPYDRWSQRDFYGFAAVFSYMQRGVDPILAEQKVRLNGVYVGSEPAETFPDPESGEPLNPRTLGGDSIAMAAGVDPRRAVWEWMVREENPYFARAMVNRVWAHYMGRGLYEPVDSQSAANPPSHPEVLHDLVEQFRESGYNLRELHRRILHLAAYQRSWRTNDSNARDEKNYSHRLLRRMTAEQLVDSVCQVTGTQPDLTKVYYTGEIREGARLIEIPLSRFRGADWHALLVFGKPRREQACDCERGTDPSLAQAMYLYNDESLWKKITAEDGRLAQLVNDLADDEKLIGELYLWTLSRQPSADELAQTQDYVASAPDRLSGYQDVLWSLLNRQDFLVLH